MNNTIQHHGILGMKWGVRRYQNKDGTLTPEGKKRKGDDSKTRATNGKDSEQHSKPRTVKDLTDDELRTRINRLEMEKRYKDLVKSSETKKVSKGKAFVIDVLEKSGKNIASQVTTYAMGSIVNKIAGKTIVNPKKGQKDK